VKPTSPRGSHLGFAPNPALGSLAAFREALSARAVAVPQPDLGACGGFSGSRRIAALADAFDVRTMPHVVGSLVNPHASLQMGALLTARRGIRR